MAMPGGIARGCRRRSAVHADLVTARVVHYTPVFMGKTLRRYLLREIGGSFLAGIAMFASILFLLRLVDLIEMTLARGVPAGLVLRLITAILPSLLEASLPMAFLLGVIAAFGRLGSDGETLALRAAGLSVWRVLPPVVGMACVVAAVTLVLSMTARPWGHREIETTLFDMARTRAAAALKPRFFNTDFEHMVVYVDRIEQGSGELVGVLLSDERGGAERQAVFARSGRIGGNSDSGRLYLQLLDGTSISSRENLADYDVTRFRSLEVNLQLRTGSGAGPADDEPAALGWNELRREMNSDDPARVREAGIEMHRRFGIAMAALTLGLVGAALGFATSGATRGRAVGISIAIILAYYAALTLGIAMAKSGALSPAPALWMPNVLLGAISLWALARNARDLPFLPFPPSLPTWRRRPAATGAR